MRLLQSAGCWWKLQDLKQMSLYVYVFIHVYAFTSQELCYTLMSYSYKVLYVSGAVSQQLLFNYVLLKSRAKRDTYKTSQTCLGLHKAGYVVPPGK